MCNAKCLSERSMNNPSAGPGATGMVFDIHRAAMHDGPGIRTTVFLKGCPLRCLWCHNPEAWSMEPQLADAPCTEDAPVMQIVRQDRPYYQGSGGGLTISGGEPTVQWAFCKELLQAARGEGISTCLDTCGFNKSEVFLDLLPLVDLFLWDYKATGEPLHSKLTGVPSGPILKNFELLYQNGASLFIRAPMIPGVNDSDEHLLALAALAQDYPKLVGIEVLPYHKIGLTKFDRFHLPRPILETHVPDAEDLARWRRFLPSQILIST